MWKQVTKNEFVDKLIKRAKESDKYCIVDM